MSAKNRGNVYPVIGDHLPHDYKKSISGKRTSICEKPHSASVFPLLPWGALSGQRHPDDESLGGPAETMRSRVVTDQCDCMVAPTVSSLWRMRGTVKGSRRYARGIVKTTEPPF